MNISNAPSNFFNTHRPTSHNFQQASNPQFINTLRKDLPSHNNSTSPFQTNTASFINGSGSLRENIINNISQARVGTSTAFSTPSKLRNDEPFDIRNYYSMSPEEVKPMMDNLREELFYETDFSGMTGEEIYKHIENRYIETFGKDFMMANKLLTVFYAGGANLTAEDSLTTNYAYVTIGQDFYGALNFLTLHLRGQNSPFTDFIRTSLYGNMSDSEIMDAIKNKYPQPLTNRSLVLINSDLYAVNLGMFDDGRYVDAHIMHPSESVANGTMPHWTELEARWTNILNRPANIPLLSAIQNVHLKEAKSHTPALPFALQAKEMLVKLGAPLGNDGYFLHKLSKEQLLHLFGIADEYEIPGTKDVKIDKDLIDDFIEDLAKHEKSMKETREHVENSRSSKEVHGVYESTSDNYHNSIISTSDYLQ